MGPKATAIGDNIDEARWIKTTTANPTKAYKKNTRFGTVEEYEITNMFCKLNTGN